MAGTTIVGAGQAGAQFALSLREAGYTSPISLIAGEAHIPYHRPPLSKGYMAGEISASELPIRTAAYYDQLGIELHMGVPAMAVNREAHTVVLSNGRQLPYERLVLATGARNRKLSFDGVEPSNAHYLRTWEDADKLRTALPMADDVLIIGAGFIGLEFASVAVAAGKRTTVVEISPRVMGRTVSELTSNYFAQQHRAAGTELLCGTSIDEFIRDAAGRVTAVRIGVNIRAVDLLVIGIGVTPNTELAEQAGLAVDAGIVVDSSLATADPTIFAIGDCARHPRPDSPGLVRVESVQNAADQARFLARRITTGSDEYRDVPWFWSHQGHDKLQIAGLAQPADESFLIGDPASRHFSVARLRQERLVAVESINAAADHLASRKLFANAVNVTGAELRDPAFSFRGAWRHAAENRRSVA